MTGIGPAWSLAVEAVFYCALPVLVLAARFARDRRRIVILPGPPLLLLIFGVAAHVLPVSPTDGYQANWHSVLERSFWARTDLFSFGMVVAVLHTEALDGWLVLPVGWRRLSVAAGVLVFLVWACSMHQPEQSYRLQNTGEALGIAFVFAAIVLPGEAAERPMRVVRVLETRVPVAVGVVSYSLFLWHYPVIRWLAGHGLTLGGGPGCSSTYW